MIRNIEIIGALNIVKVTNVFGIGIICLIERQIKVLNAK